MSDYRKPAGKAPEPPPEAAAPEDRFMLAVRAQDVSLAEHGGRIFDVRFLRRLGDDDYVFEVVEYRPAPWWRFWNRSADKLRTELVRGGPVGRGPVGSSGNLSVWKNASGLDSSTPKAVLDGAVTRRKWLDELVKAQAFGTKS